MKEYKILIDTIDKVKAFCKKANEIDGDILVESGRYAVDGKSIMGIFSLNLSKPLTMKVVNDEADIDGIREFIVAYGGHIADKK